MSKYQPLQQPSFLRPLAQGFAHAIYAIDRNAVASRPYLAQRFRKDAKTVIWEIRQNGRTPISTGCVDLDDAEEFFAVWQAKQGFKSDVMSVPVLETIAEIADDVIENQKPPKTAIYSLQRRWTRDKMALEWAVIYCRGKAICDVNQVVLDGFIASLCGETKTDVWGRALPDRKGGPLKRSSAEQYATNLLRVLKSRPVPPGAWLFRSELKIRRTNVARITLVTPEEVARLLWSCWRGWVWDAETGGWKTETVVDPQTGQEVTRRFRQGWSMDLETGRWAPDPGGVTIDGVRDGMAGRRRAFARYILFYLHTGTRCATIRSLRWKRDVRWGSIAIGSDGRVTLHRKGVNAKESKTKKADSTQLPSRFAAHVRRWARMAAPKPGDPKHWRKCDFVVPDERGRLMRQVSHEFDGAVFIAGLNPDSVTPHTFKHACVTWALENGWNIHRIGKLTSTTPEVLQLVYAQWIEEFDLLGGTMPPSIRGARTLH